MRRKRRHAPDRLIAGGSAARRLGGSAARRLGGLLYQRVALRKSRAAANIPWRHGPRRDHEPRRQCFQSPNPPGRPSDGSRSALSSLTPPPKTLPPGDPPEHRTRSPRIIAHHACENPNPHASAREDIVRADGMPTPLASGASPSTICRAGARAAAHGDASGSGNETSRIGVRSGADRAARTHRLCAWRSDGPGEPLTARRLRCAMCEETDPRIPQRRRHRAERLALRRVHRPPSCGAVTCADGFAARRRTTGPSASTGGNRNIPVREVCKAPVPVCFAPAVLV